ncbi:MAG TPA: PVC-type heme-binding CxxCH protein, partial [Rhodothermales bacterium]
MNVRSAPRRPVAVLLVFVLSIAAGCSGAGVVTDAASPADAEVDVAFTLEASMLGFRGVGGAIDGVRNPVLRAAPGERVRITIVGVEVLPHDLALEKAGVKTEEVVEVGDRASIDFVARENDVYFCTIPGHRAAGMEGRFEVREEGGEEAVAVGLVPQHEGRPLNLGFEAGTWVDWTASGEAFGPAPVEGDAVAAESGDIPSRHEGFYWANSSAAAGPRATGRLVSESFTVTEPFLSFLVAGGALKDTRVELVRAGDDSVLFEITGTNHPSLRPVVVDLTEQLGGEIYVRLIDDETGISDIPYIPDHAFAYISFDDVRLHATRPSFDNELRPSEIQILPPIDHLPYAGLSGEEAATAMTVPEGFKVVLAASEPDIVRPIAFAQDDRGRLWVVEANTYPVRAPEGEGKDRLYIFEDTNGDGTLDDRKLVVDDLNLVSGIEVGFGGVWIGAAPYLLFIPIDPETDKPSGPPEILLDGWGYDDTHETLNSLQWGPDGWLYGTHGVFTESNVGKPGTPDDQRVHINAGVWRYHPTRHVFERFMEGTSNPWGIDFDDFGQGFITACVIPHLYQTIPGSHLQRQAGEHDNPYVFEDIDTHADHVHWVGTYGPHAGNNRSG